METNLVENCTEWWQQVTAKNYDPNHPCRRSTNSILNADTDSTNAWAHNVSQILYGIFCIAGLLGNSVIVYLLIRYRKLQSITHFYILNLAITNLGFLIGTPLEIVAGELGYWPFGNFMCKSYYVTAAINQITVFTLLVLSLDRYLLLYHPSQRRSKVSTAIALAVVWVLSVYFSWPVISYADTPEIDGKLHCNTFWPDWGDVPGETYYLLRSFVIEFAIQFPFVFILNTLSAMKLCCRGTAIVPRNANENEEFMQLSGSCQNENCDASTCRESKRSDSVGKLVIVVTTIYFIGWAPYWAVEITIIGLPSDDVPSYLIDLLLLSGCLVYAVPAINPLIYFWLSVDMRESLLSTLNYFKSENYIRQSHGIVRLDRNDGSGEVNL